MADGSFLGALARGAAPAAAFSNSDLVDQRPGRGFFAALTDWLGKTIRLTDSGFWREWVGSSVSGEPVTINRSLQLSTVWACVRLISETVSTLPLRVYQRMPDGSRQLAQNHPLYRLLSVSPNKEMTPARFMLMVVASICLWGNAFVEKRYIGTKLVALDPLLPQRMVVKRLDDGSLEYTYTTSGAQRVIPERSIMHIRGFGLDGICGLQPIQQGREVFGSAASANNAAAAIFAKGMNASGFLSSDNTLTAEQRSQIRDSLARFAGSNSAGRLMVLEAGMKYQGITMNPEAAQMLETRGFNVEEICRWFRVPPFKVGHMDKASSWASSSETQNMQFLTDCLRPVIENIEQEIQRCLMTPADQGVYYAEFSVEGLLRADSAGRAAYYHAALNDGWMNRDTVCTKENLPKPPGGDIYTVAVNLVPLDQLGKQPSGNEQARGAMASWLGLDRMEAALNQLTAASKSPSTNGSASLH